MSVTPILPFLPFPPFRTPGHDMETDNKLCHNKHSAMNAESECLDKTQIRGYSRDTPAHNESYLHTRVTWCDVWHRPGGTLSHSDPWNDSWQLFGDNVWQLLSNTVIINTVPANQSTLLRLKPHKSLTLKAVQSKDCLLVIIKCQ